MSKTGRRSPISLPKGEVTVEAITNRHGPWKTDPHYHDCYELLFIIRGSNRFLLDGKTYTARRGDLIVFRPGETHEEWSLTQSQSILVLRFHPEMLAEGEATFPPPEKLPPVLRLPWTDRFQELFARMVEEREHGQDDSSLLLGAYLVEFTVLLNRAVDAVAPAQSKAAAATHKRVRTTIDLIRQNLDGSLSLAEMARETFMSKSHFSHVFKETVGEAPKAFQIEERIRKAKEMLLNTDMPASEIAASLGYDNPFYFYRLFKKKTGQTTTQFRQTAD